MFKTIKPDFEGYNIFLRYDAINFTNPASILYYCTIQKFAVIMFFLCLFENILKCNLFL